MINIDEYKELVQEFVNCLSRKDYQAANNLILDNSVPISDLRKVIEEYGTTIIPIPDAAFEQASCYQVSDKQVDIYISLWSEEEGQSDLTLSLSCYQNEHKIQINDLEVL